jgi:prevent-host-death family protein
MKTYSTSDLARALGDVTHAAVAEPVVITYHAKPRYVLMSIAVYEGLAKAERDPRRAWLAEEASSELADSPMAAVNETPARPTPSDGV